MRRLMLLTFVGLAGAGVAILPSLGSAQATTASFTAVDNGNFFPVPTWNAGGATAKNQGDLHAVSIVPGGTVTFSYPTGTSTYNAVFDGAQPSSCVQTAAGPAEPISPAPPLPKTSQRAGWSGTCRFDAAGTYTFHDAFRGVSMSGTVVVGTDTGPAPTTTTQPTGMTTNFNEPPIPAAATSLRAASTQHGSAVRGTIDVTAPGSRLIADLFSGHPSVLLGRTTLHRVGDGRQRFTTRLDARGRRAQRLHHRLSLTLRVQVLLSGALGPTTLNRHVTLIG